MTARPRRRVGPLLALAAGVALLAALGRLVSSEVFLDGVTYAAVARNLAAGDGSFWGLRYLGHPFTAHPPLALWLESLAFRLLGAAPWVERLWGVAQWGAALALTAALWRRLFPSASARRLVWWPLLLCASSPLLSWCAAHNMLENTLGPLVLLAALLLVAALDAPAAGRRRALAALGGAAVLLGVLVKGPPALFVLAAPPAWWAAGRGRVAGRAAAEVLLAALAGLALAGALVALAGGAEAAGFWRAYLSSQLAPSMAGQLERAPSRWWLVARTLDALALPCLVGAAVGAIGRRRLAAAGDGRRAAALVAVGLAGVLPFLAFQKQMEWYVAPALPFLLLGLAAATRNAALAVTRWVEARRPARAAAWSAAALAALAAALLAGPLGGALDVPPSVALRDRLAAARGARVDDRFSEYAWRHFRRDVLSAPPAELRPGAVVSAVAPASYWRLAAYAERHLRVSLTQERGQPLVLAERLPEDPPGEPVNCTLLQRERPVRLFVYRCER